MLNLRHSAKTEMDKTKDPILSYPWHDPVAYGLWLSQTYYMVNYSTRLVALAGALSPIDRNDLHARFVDHSQEERGHQKVCISDLKNIGFTLADFPQMFQSACMYQIQYFWIQQKHPIAFFGYTLALESLAGNFGSILFDRVREAHGEKAGNFLKLHSEDDIEHIEKAHDQLEKLNEAEKALVQENLEISSAIYRSMLVEGKILAHQLKTQKIA